MRISGLPAHPCVSNRDLDKAYEQLMSELSQYEFTMDKDLKVLERCDQEIEYYKEESDKISRSFSTQPFFQRKIHISCPPRLNRLLQRTKSQKLTNA